MTQEEKALAYDEALRLARDYYEDENCFKYIKGALEHIFCELKEPDDEDIRKTLFETFSNFNAAGTFWTDILQISKDKVLTWLEKLKMFAEHGDGLYYFANNDFTYIDNPTWDNVSFLEKQGEQKPVDKAEPKFKVGDWIACEELNTALIVNIDDDRYEVEFIDGNKGFPHIDYIDRDFHLWTIQDAKVGDVLVCKGNIKNSNGIKYERICLFNNPNNAFFTLTKTSNYVEEYDINVIIDYPDNTVPATKEQKEILFMAMKDAGYEWDDKKKELRKMEQKSKWTEEDEKILMHIIQDVELLLGDEDERFEDERRQSLLWLKSLKQKIEWKPTKEQIYERRISYGSKRFNDW